MRATLTVLLLTLYAVCATAETGPSVDDEARRAIRTTIQAQLDAFRADDAETAFGFASPDIQQQFGNPERFMVMVRTGYAPVYDNREAFFRETVEVRGVIAQKVLIVDGNNDSVLAIYPMQRQPDGSWRIAGCYLAAPGGQSI